MMQKNFSFLNNDIDKSAGGQLFLICIVANLMFGFIFMRFLGHETFASQTIGFFVAQMAFFASFGIISFSKKTSLTKSLNIKKTAPWHYYIILPALIISILFLTSKLVGVLDVTFEKIGFNNQDIIMPVNLWQLFVMLFFVALLPAIFEEAIFRGVIAKSFSKYGAIFAVVGSSLLFALIHASVYQTVYQFMLGVVLALIILKTGDYKLAVVAHFTNNAFSIIYNYFVTSNGVASTSAIDWIIGILLFAAAAGLVFVVFKFLIKHNKQKGSTLDAAPEVFEKFNVPSFAFFAIVASVAWWILNVILSLAV